MRFMILVRAGARSEAGAAPEAPLRAAMAAFQDELAHAGVLLDAAGLEPSANGWHVAGYTLIQARSREEAVEWSRRFPAPAGFDVDGAVEVRQLVPLTHA